MSVFTHFFFIFRNDIVFSSRLSTFYTTFSAMMKVFLSVIIEEKQFFWTICIAKMKMNHELIKHCNKFKCVLYCKNASYCSNMTSRIITYFVGQQVRDIIKFVQYSFVDGGLYFFLGWRTAWLGCRGLGRGSLLLPITFAVREL